MWGGVLAAILGVLPWVAGRMHVARWSVFCIALVLAWIERDAWMLLPGVTLCLAAGPGLQGRLLGIAGLSGVALVTPRLSSGPWWVWVLPPLCFGAWRAAQRLGPGPAWVGVTAAAMACYTAVPDTEEITIVATAALLVTPAVLQKQESASAVLALVALMVWACAHGAAGRPPAFVVAPATLAGVVVIGAVCPRGSLTWSSPAGISLILVHFVLCLLICRTAGLERAFWPALTTAMSEVVVGGLVLAALAAWFVRRHRGRAPQRV